MIFCTIMKRIACYILLLTLVSMFSIDVCAAGTKKKTFTKRYKNEKLIVVLNDLCKRNNYTLNILDEIDTEKRITAEFKNASTGNVLKKVLDKEYQGKVKKGVLTISRKPSPPITYTSRATTPSETIETDSVVRTIYKDTVYTVKCMMKTVKEEVQSTKKEVAEPKDENWRRHNLQILLGGGYGSMGYDLKSAGKEIGSFGGGAQVRYLYYFTPKWGIGAGVGFATYGSTGTLNTTTVFNPNVYDSDPPKGAGSGEGYEHRVKTRDWQEKQRAYMIDVPVLIQCSYPTKSTLANGPLKVYADVGADLGFALAASRRLTGGAIDHTGWYDAWNLELSHIDDHDFYTEQASDFGTGSQPIELKLPAVGLTADVGIAIPVAQSLDLLIGAYAVYTVNNICTGQKAIGWKQADASPDYRKHEFMNEYSGLIGTQYTSSVHPWQAGLRIGLNFNSRPKPKQAPAPEVLYKRINVCDTTSVLEERVVTTVKAVTVQKIQRVLEKSVIWFEKNSTEPQLKPADILVKVAEILKENPTQKILITGHASREGSKAKNQQLSEERARVVADMLRQLGVQDSQIVSRGEGTDRDYEAGEHNISLDRRVEITTLEN